MERSRQEIEGYKAAKSGFTFDSNPYNDSFLWRLWLKGFDSYHDEICTDGDSSLSQAQNKMWC